MNLAVDLISDVICPWCYIGKRHLEKGSTALGDQYRVQVRWHPFQLNPASCQTASDAQSLNGETRLNDSLRFFYPRYLLIGLRYAKQHSMRVNLVCFATLW